MRHDHPYFVWKSFSRNDTDFILHTKLFSSVVPLLGRKFVSILMRFWYLTSARLPDETVEGARIFQVSIGGEGETETKRLLTANYE